MLLFQAETLRAVDIVWETLLRIWAGLFERLPYIVIGLIVMIAFWMGGRLIQRALLTAGDRTRLDGTLARLLGRLIGAVMFVLGLLVAAVVVFPTFKPGDLVAGLGITSVAIGFAFKDVLQNFFAGILILWRRPFVIGDAIIVNGYEGTVEEINVRATRIKTYDHERAIIPNGDVYTSAVLVQTAYPARRLKVTVGISYEDDIETARGIIQGVLERTEGVYKDPAPFVVVKELASSSVNLMALFWIDPRDSSLKMRDRVATGIKYALDDGGIDMSLPQSLIFASDEPERQETEARPEKRRVAEEPD
jgi:small conductance mechanosensitive channel